MKRGFILFCSLAVYSCEAFDLSTSSQVYQYPRPSIERLALQNNALTVTISISLNPINRDDFSSYLIFVTENGNSFAPLLRTDFNNPGLDTFTTLPFFITNTARPTFFRDGVQNLNQNITLASRSFATNQSYKVTVLAWGLNEEFARSFDNNGWILSPFAEEKNFHYRQERLRLMLNQFSEKTNNNDYGFNVIDDEIVSINVNLPSDDPLSSTNQVIFYFNDSGVVDMGMFFTSGGSLIQSLGPTHDFFEVIALPEDGYLAAGVALPVNRANTYAIKNSDNTYMKIYVNNLNIASAIKVIDLNVAYSIVPHERNF